MASKRAKFSQHGANARCRVDQLALSPVARRQTVKGVALGDFTQSTTTKYSRGPLGFDGTLKAAYLSARTAPAGGVLSVTVKAFSAVGGTEITLCNSFDPATLTARKGSALVLATTNVALKAADTIEIHETADGSAISQQQVDGHLSLVFERTEDTVIND